MPFEISNHQGDACDALHSDLTPVGAPQLPLVLGNLCTRPSGFCTSILSCLPVTFVPSSSLGGTLLSLQALCMRHFYLRPPWALGLSVPAQVKGTVL